MKIQVGQRWMYKNLISSAWFLSHYIVEILSIDDYDCCRTKIILVLWDRDYHPVIGSVHNKKPLLNPHLWTLLPNQNTSNV